MTGITERERDRQSRRADYEMVMRRDGLWPVAPIVIDLPTDDGPVVDGYRSLLSGPVVRGGEIYSVRYTNHHGPTGEWVRDIMLQTRAEIGKPWYIDTIINGVPLLLRWNGSRPAVQWTPDGITAEEATAIEGGILNDQRHE